MTRRRPSLSIQSVPACFFQPWYSLMDEFQVLPEFSRVGMASPVGGGCRVMLSLFNDQRLRQCCRTDLIDAFLRAAEEQSIRHGRRWTGGHLPCGRRPGRGPKRDQAKSQCCSYDEPSNRRHRHSPRVQVPSVASHSWSDYPRRRGANQRPPLSEAGEKSEVLWRLMVTWTRAAVPFGIIIAACQGVDAGGVDCSPGIDVNSVVAAHPSPLSAYATPLPMPSTIMAARSVVFMVIFLPAASLNCWP
jgi:hypothetical protein